MARSWFHGLLEPVEDRNNKNLSFLFLSMEILNVIKSRYCWIVGFLAALLGYHFILKPFLTPYSPLDIVILSYVFLVLFSMSVSCMVKNIKNTIHGMKGASLLSILAYVLGFSSIQTCFASGVCVANLSVPIIATFFPSFLRDFFESFSSIFLGLSILLIVISLYFMKCFEKREKTMEKKLSFNL